MKNSRMTIEIRDHVLFMGLNRPEKYSAFNESFSFDLMPLKEKRFDIFISSDRL